MFEGGGGVNGMFGVFVRDGIDTWEVDVAFSRVEPPILTQLDHTVWSNHSMKQSFVFSSVLWLTAWQSSLSKANIKPS